MGLKENGRSCILAGYVRRDAWLLCFRMIFEFFGEGNGRLPNF